MPRSGKKGFNELIKNAKTAVGKGGRFIILEVPGKTPPYFGRKFESNGVEGLPFSANMLNKGTTLGLWAGKPHMVKEHPVFKGLPTGDYGVYQNVHPKPHDDATRKMISGVVSYDHFQNLDLMLRHYRSWGHLVWPIFRNHERRI